MNLNTSISQTVSDVPINNKLHQSIDQTNMSFPYKDESKNVKKKISRTKYNNIEKLKRIELNTQFDELSKLLSSGHKVSRRKMSSVTMLETAVKQVKSMQSIYKTYMKYKPYFHAIYLNKNFQNLITHVCSDSFVFVVNCLQGDILYASNNVTKLLNYIPADLIGSNLFDYIHSDDIAKVKEQLFSSNINPDYIDENTKLMICDAMLNEYSSGARRSFVCKIKCKDNDAKINDLNMSTKSNYVIPSGKQYTVIQCTGYLKSWSDDSSLKNLEQINVKDCAVVNKDHKENNICMVTVCRVINNTTYISNLSGTLVEPLYFTTKHTVEGKYLFVDQYVTYLVGFLPQELLGTCIYEYIHYDDISKILDLQIAIIQESKPRDTEIYKFLNKDKMYVHLRSEWKSFQNPWTKEIDFIVAKNYLIKSDFNCDNSTVSAVCQSQNQCLAVVKGDQKPFDEIKMENQCTLHLENDIVFTEKKKYRSIEPSSLSLSDAALACRPSTSSGSGSNYSPSINGVGYGTSTSDDIGRASYAPVYTNYRQDPWNSAYSDLCDMSPSLPNFVLPSMPILELLDEIIEDKVSEPSSVPSQEHSVIFESKAEEDAVTDIMMNLLETDSASIFNEMMHYPELQWEMP